MSGPNKVQHVQLPVIRFGFDIADLFDLFGYSVKESVWGPKTRTEFAR